MACGADSSYGSVARAPCSQQGACVHGTAQALIGAALGGGLLTMSYVVARLGWALGTLVTILFVLMNAHISHLLWRVYMRFPQAQSLVELAQFAFMDAPHSVRIVIAYTVGPSQKMFLFSTLGFYMVLNAKALGMAMHDLHLCLPTWTMLCVLVLILPSASGQRIDSYPVLNDFNTFSIAGVVCFSLAALAALGLQETRPDTSRVLPVADGMTTLLVFRALSSLFFATTSQNLFVDVMAEMKNPREFPKAHAFFVPFQLTVLLTVGLGCYYLVGSAIRDRTIIELLPVGIWLRVIAILLFGHMAVAYLIKSTILCKILHTRPASNPADSARPPSMLSWPIVAASVLTSAAVVGQIVPFVDDLVGMLGAGLLPFSAWLVPIAMSAQVGDLRWCGRQPWAALESSLIVVYCALAVAITVIGTYAAWEDVVGKWHTYGGVFRCHCEYMWSTCGCSASRPGMQSCADATSSI